MTLDSPDDEYNHVDPAHFGNSKGKKGKGTGKKGKKGAEESFKGAC